MLHLCWEDLYEYGCVGRIQVIFQYGESQTQKTTAGKIFKGWMPLSVFVPRIYVYAYGHHPRYHVYTLAHEFGHLYHFQCIKDSYQWTPEEMEQFADMYADAKLKQWDEYRQNLLRFSSVSHDHQLKLLSVLRSDDHE